MSDIKTRFIELVDRWLNESEDQNLGAMLEVLADLAEKDGLLAIPSTEQTGRVSVEVYPHDEHVWAVVAADEESGEPVYLDLLKRVWTFDAQLASLFKESVARDFARDNNCEVEKRVPAIMRSITQDFDPLTLVERNELAELRQFKQKWIDDTLSAHAVSLPSVGEMADWIASAKREYNVLHGSKALPDYAKGETAPPLVFAANFIAEKILALLADRLGPQTQSDIAKTALTTILVGDEPKAFAIAREAMDEMSALRSNSLGNPVEVGELTEEQKEALEDHPFPWSVGGKSYPLGETGDFTWSVHVIDANGKMIDIWDGDGEAQAVLEIMVMRANALQSAGVGVKP